MTDDISRVYTTAEDSRINYNKQAAGYDRFASWEREYIDHGLQVLNIKPGERYFELGYGTGYAMHYAKQSGASVFGIDVSEGMKERTRNRLGAMSESEADMLIVGDFLQHDFQDAQFDCVFASFVVELFDSPLLNDVLDKLAGLLRPEGRCVVVSMSKDGGNFVMQGLYEFAHKIAKNTVDCRPIRLGVLLGANSNVRMISKDVLPMYGLSVEVCQFARAIE